MKTGIAVLLLTAALPGLATADAAAGKAKFEAACADCHEPADFAGKSAAELTTTLKGISAGTIKHKGKVKLSDAEITGLVAHLAPSPATSATAPSSAKTAPAAKGTAAPSAAPASSKSTAATTSAATPSARPAAPVASTPAPSSSAVPAAKAAATAGAAGAGATAGATTPAGGAGGKALFDQQCADCHEAAEFAGKSAADLEKTIAGIVAGTVKHKGKIKLAAAETKQVAAWLATAR